MWLKYQAANGQNTNWTMHMLCSLQVETPVPYVSSFQAKDPLVWVNLVNGCNQDKTTRSRLYNIQLKTGFSVYMMRILNNYSTSVPWIWVTTSYQTSTGRNAQRNTSKSAKIVAKKTRTPNILWSMVYELLYHSVEPIKIQEIKKS